MRGEGSEPVESSRGILGTWIDTPETETIGGQEELSGRGPGDGVNPALGDAKWDFGMPDDRPRSRTDASRYQHSPPAAADPPRPPIAWGREVEDHVPGSPPGRGSPASPDSGRPPHWTPLRRERPSRRLRRHGGPRRRQRRAPERARAGPAAGTASREAARAGAGRDRARAGLRRHGAPAGARVGHRRSREPARRRRGASATTRAPGSGRLRSPRLRRQGAPCRRVWYRRASEPAWRRDRAPGRCSSWRSLRDDPRGGLAAGRRRGDLLQLARTSATTPEPAVRGRVVA